MIQYNFCSNCGNKIIEKSDPAHCKKCDAVYYRNAKPTASVFPVKDGKVLLAIRAQEPFKGQYDVVGGFMEAWELPEAAALREAKEETGLDIRITSLLGIYVDRYGENGDYTLNIHYVGEVVGGTERAMDDVASLVWLPIEATPQDSGSPSMQEGLRDLKKYLDKERRNS